MQIVASSCHSLSGVFVKLENDIQKLFKIQATDIRGESYPNCDKFEIPKTRLAKLFSFYCHWESSTSSRKQHT